MCINHFHFFVFPCFAFNSHLSLCFALVLHEGSFYGLSNANGQVSFDCDELSFQPTHYCSHFHKMHGQWLNLLTGLATLERRQSMTSCREREREIYKRKIEKVDREIFLTSEMLLFINLVGGKTKRFF